MLISTVQRDLYSFGVWLEHHSNFDKHTWYFTAGYLAKRRFHRRSGAVLHVASHPSLRLTYPFLP